MGSMPPAIGLIGIGWYVATCIVLGVVAGLWLDGQTHTKPLFALLGLGLGLTAAGYGGYRMLMDVLKGRGRPK
jgi:F0F1-type ATP synthase assembly protein I